MIRVGKTAIAASEHYTDMLRLNRWRICVAVAHPVVWWFRAVVGVELETPLLKVAVVFAAVEPREQTFHQGGADPDAALV